MNSENIPSTGDPKPMTMKMRLEAARYVDSWRDVIVREKWSYERIALELSRKIDFAFTKSRVAGIMKALGINPGGMAGGIGPKEAGAKNREKLALFEKRIAELEANRINPEVAAAVESLSAKLKAAEALIVKLADDAAGKDIRIQGMENTLAVYSKRIDKLESALDHLLTELGYKRLDAAVSQAVSGKPK